MPSLDSPIITLGALFLAGNKAPEYTGGESGVNIAAGGFGAASADFVATEARNMLGIDSTTVSDELARAAVGAALSNYGGAIPRNNAMARAIHYDVARSAVDGAGFSLGQMFDGDLLGGGGSSGGSATAAAPPVETAPAPEMNSGAGTRVY